MRNIILILSLLVVGCGTGLPSIKPYKMDIQQGNVVTSKMMLQLKPGMTKSQVRFILGTPLLQDTFHRDRWDYFFQLSKAGKVVEQRRVIVEFENDLLAKIRGDVIPASTNEAGVEVESKPAVKQVEKKKGWMDSLKFWESDDKQATTPHSAPADLVNKKDVAPAAAPAKVEAPAQIVAPVKPEASAKPAAPIAKPVAPAPAPPAPAPEVKPDPPVVKPAPVVQPAPASKVEPAAKTEPAKEVETKKPAESTEPAKATPNADKPLPSEDEPGYFEKLLEKIGF